MRTEGIRGKSRARIRVVLLALTVLPALMPAKQGGAALLGGSYELTWEQDVDKTASETTNIRELRQTLELKWKGFLAPVVENEATLKIEQELNTDEGNVTRLLPTLDLGFKGKYWEATVGGKQTHENSDDPSENPKVTESYVVEFFYLAPRRVPDLKVKYAIDKDFEEGTTDTVQQEIILSSVYGPTDWLALKGDYDRIVSDDRKNLDSDTEDEKINGSVAFRHFFSEKFKVESEYDLEITRGATLLDAGGAQNQEEDQNHTWKNVVAFRPFSGTDLAGSYDIDLKEDMTTGEHTQESSLKLSLLQLIGTPVQVKAEYEQIVTEDRHTLDDSRKTEETWTLETRVKLTELFDATLQYEREDTDEVHVVAANSQFTGTETWTAAWTGELGPFWKAYVSFDKTDTTDRDILTTVDTKYSFKSTFDFKAIQLTLDPTYEITKKDDRVGVESTTTRDFRFRIAYTLFTTRTMESKLDHTYGRITDSGAGTIQRTDDSTWNLTWTDPIPGWLVSFDITRNATDTSEDDLPPDITSSFGFKVDYKQDHLLLNTSYKFDKKSLTDNAETFDAKVGWVAPKWDVSLTYKFDKTFSEELNEGYTLTLAFKYNL